MQAGGSQRRMCEVLFHGFLAYCLASVYLVELETMFQLVLGRGVGISYSTCLHLLMLGSQAPTVMPTCELSSWWLKSKDFSPLSHVPSSLIQMSIDICRHGLMGDDSLNVTKVAFSLSLKGLYVNSSRWQREGKVNPSRKEQNWELREKRHRECLWTYSYTLCFETSRKDAGSLDLGTESYVFKLKSPPPHTHTDSLFECLIPRGMKSRDMVDPAEARPTRQR